MGARTLEARLSARLLALVVAVLTSVGIITAIVTDRTLTAADEERAAEEANAARDALTLELSEGDSQTAAAQEVIAAADGEGVRLSVRFADGSRFAARAGQLPLLSASQCTTAVDAAGLPWRACGAATPAATVVAAIPIAAHRRAVSAVWRATTAVVAVGALLLWWAIRRALRAPLAELTSLVAWTRRVGGQASGGEGPITAQTTEIAQLATAFDALVRDLLEALARERSNSAHMAHELRTPLTAIMAELDASIAAEPSASGTARRIRSDVARLTDVIDAILVLSDRSTSRRKEVVNIADIARELVVDGATVEAPDEALVESDERLVRLALRNLIDNANRYGGGARVVRISRDGDGVRLAVLDGGDGLDPLARERMFDRYWRRAADGEGSGLGLALVRAVAERHGGGVRATTGVGGHGLEVSLTLSPILGWHDPASG